MPSKVSKSSSSSMYQFATFFSAQFAMHVYGEEEPTKVVASSLGLTPDGEVNFEVNYENDEA